MQESLDTNFHNSIKELGKELLAKLEYSVLHNKGFTSFAKRLVLTNPVFEDDKFGTASEKVKSLEIAVKEFINSEFSEELNKYKDFEFSLSFTILKTSKKVNMNFYLLKKDAQSKLAN
jgi:hypothetical protein